MESQQEEKINMSGIGEGKPIILPIELLYLITKPMVDAGCVPLALGFLDFFFIFQTK